MPDVSTLPVARVVLRVVGADLLRVLVVGVGVELLRDLHRQAVVARRDACRDDPASRERRTIRGCRRGHHVDVVHLEVLRGVSRVARAWIADSRKTEGAVEVEQVRARRVIGRGLPGLKQPFDAAKFPLAQVTASTTSLISMGRQR